MGPLVGFVATVAAVAAIVPIGYVRGGRSWADAVLAGLVVLGIGLALWLAIGLHDPEMTDEAFYEGMALAVVSLGMALPLVLYTVGRLLAGRGRRVLLAAYTLSLIAVGYYLLLILILVADRTACPVDQYECPL